MGWLIRVRKRNYKNEKIESKWPVLRKQVVQKILVAEITLKQWVDKQGNKIREDRKQKKEGRKEKWSYEIELKIPGKIASSDISNPAYSFIGGIVKVIDDGNPEAFLEKLQYGVRSYEARPSRHQNGLLFNISRHWIYLEGNERR